MSRVFDISVDKIWSRGRGREGAWGRGIAGYVGRRLCGYSNKRMAEYFHRDPVVVSRGIGRVKEKIRLDKGFERRLRRLEEEMVRGRKRKIRN